MPVCFLFFYALFPQPYAKDVALMYDSLCLSRSFSALFLRACAAQRVYRFLLLQPPNTATSAL